jgi:hypothetical protein
MTSLSADQVEFFVEHYWLKLEDAVPKELCSEWVEAACRYNGIELSDPTTWPSRNNFISAGLSGKMEHLAPRLYGAIVQLIGGSERLAQAELEIDSGLVANWDRGADSPWVEPGFKNEYEWKSGGECGGWHVDGDFNHFVDSPEAGLQVFILWADVEYMAGPTYIAPDSPPHLTKVLLDNPSGLSACALGGGAAMCSFCHLTPVQDGAAFCCRRCDEEAKRAGWTAEGLPPASVGGWPADLKLEGAPDQSRGISHHFAVEIITTFSVSLSFSQLD